MVRHCGIVFGGRRYRAGICGAVCHGRPSGIHRGCGADRIGCGALSGFRSRRPRVVGCGRWHCGVSAVYRRSGRVAAGRSRRLVAGRPRLIRTARRDLPLLGNRRCRGVPCRVRAHRWCEGVVARRRGLAAGRRGLAAGRGLVVWRRGRRPMVRQHGRQRGVEPRVAGGWPSAVLRRERRAGGARVLAGRALAAGRPGLLVGRHRSGPLTVRLPRRDGQWRRGREIRPAGLRRRGLIVAHGRVRGPAAQRLESGRGLRGVTGGQAALRRIVARGWRLPRVLLLRRYPVVAGGWHLTRYGLDRRRHRRAVRLALPRLLVGGSVVLVAAPALAALLRPRGLRAFRLGCAILETSASAAEGFLDEFLVREVLHRRFVAALCDVALRQPRRQHGKAVIATAHGCASLRLGVPMTRSLRSLTTSLAAARLGRGQGRTAGDSLATLTHTASPPCRSLGPDRGRLRRCLARCAGSRIPLDLLDPNTWTAASLRDNPVPSRRRTRRPPPVGRRLRNGRRHGYTGRHFCPNGNGSVSWSGGAPMRRLFVCERSAQATGPSEQNQANKPG